MPIQALLTLMALLLSMVLSPCHAEDVDAPPVFNPPYGLTTPVADNLPISTRSLGSRFTLILAENRSLTFQEQPTLYWFASGGIKQVEFMVFEGDGLKPLIQTVARNISTAGIFPLSLKQYGVSLKPNVVYRWVAVLLPEGSGRAATTLTAEIVHDLPDATTQRQLDAASQEQKPAVYGAAGAWCDLFDALTQQVALSRDSLRWVARRAKLLRQVGLIDVARADEAQLPLELSVQSDKTHYRAGDHVSLTLAGNRRFYARIIYVDAHGNRTLVLPNERRPNPLFEGNSVHRFPEIGDDALVIAAPFGVEHIVVQASPNELAPLAGVRQADGFLHLSAPIKREPKSATIVEKTLEIVTEAP